MDWGSMADLQPDLVILDKEENTREMAESCPYPYLALHITRVEDVAPEFSRLAERIGNPALWELVRRWEQASRLDGKQ